MAAINPIQLRKRVSGVAGAPDALLTAEVAINMVDPAVMYVGMGDDGSGNATSIMAIAGPGAFMSQSGNQTIGGAKTFSVVPKSSQDATSATDLVRKSQLDLKANAANAALTGAPTAPTAAGGTNTTQIATTAFVAAAVAALVDGAPGAIDTLNELAAALGDDPNFATTVTNGLAGKLAIASNLSDLNDASVARTNLGLGTMATQNANAVAITGGSIVGTTIDGGTF